MSLFSVELNSKFYILLTSTMSMSKVTDAKYSLKISSVFYNIVMLSTINISYKRGMLLFLPSPYLVVPYFEFCNLTDRISEIWVQNVLYLEYIEVSGLSVATEHLRVTDMARDMSGAFS